MESFVFYTHYATKMKKLPPEQAAKLLFAICDYVENGTEPELDDTAADMCFSFIRTQLDKDITKYTATCRKRADAGRKGAAVTNGKRRQESANAEIAGSEINIAPAKEIQQPLRIEESESALPPSSSPPTKGKRKPKEGPVKIKYGEYVQMTEDEHKKLIDKYGPEMTSRCIEVLDNYKGSKGTTYKNDYRAILSWVVDKVNDELSKKGNTVYVGSDQIRGHNRDVSFTPSTGFRSAEPDGDQ